LRSAGINDPAAHATIGMIARSERIPPDLVACTVQYIVATQKNADGSILVFTSGVAEIDAIARAVRLQPCASDLDILTLHANQPNAKQRAIFALSKRQKLIVATNVAETSITIPDARYVIDTGKVKEIRMVDGLSRLLEVWTSRASAKQRRGRAGRTQEGLCFKLYTRWTEDQFAQHTSPEIMRIPLVRQRFTLVLSLSLLSQENLVLAVKAAHPEVSPLAFLRTLITVPPLPSIALAESTCNVLGVISGDQVTSLGRFVVGCRASYRIWS
jgi:ATP-dependent RNA helicase DHX57